jgi:hypothetical protein
MTQQFPPYDRLDSKREREPRIERKRNKRKISLDEYLNDLESDEIDTRKYRRLTRNT